MIRRSILAVGLLFLLVIPSLAQTRSIEPEKKENINRLITMVGGEKIQQAMIDQMLAALGAPLSKAAGNNERAQKMLKRFSELMNDEFKKANFSEITFNLYDKYFTNDELKSLIAFYQSPIGQKSITVMPALMQESMSLGMDKGRVAGANAMNRLSEEFPELKNIKPQR